METIAFANNPTPHAFIISILQTMEFASLTKIGLPTFGTHFASTYQILLQHFLTRIMTWASFH